MVDEENEKAATWLVVVASLFLMIPVTWLIIYLVLRKFKVKGEKFVSESLQHFLISRNLTNDFITFLCVFDPVSVLFRGMFYFLWGKIIPQSKAQLNNFCISMYEKCPC